MATPQYTQGRLGVPRMSPTAVPASDDAPPRMPEPESAPGPLREHDTGLGRPIQVASQVDELTEDDQRLLAEEADRQAQDDLAKAEELLASKPDYGWWGFLTSPAAFTFLIGIVGLVGLYLTAQTLSILNSLQAQPAWVQVVCICIMVLCAVAVVLAMVRFTGVFFRLRANQQVRLSGIRELEQRTQLRWVARAQSQSARERLEQYLRDYPLQTEAERKRLRALGCSDEQLTRLIAVREELLDANRFVSTAAWFDRFSAEFQAPIDAVASQRVVFWAKRAGITTAVAPNALVDSSAVLFCGFHMMTDLCQLYALRAGPTGTAIILGRVFFHSYLAGQLNDWEKLTEEQLNHLVSPHGPLYEAFAARALTKIGAKATSGLLNYFLMQRLGKFACRLLRPVA